MSRRTGIAVTNAPIATAPGRVPEGPLPAYGERLPSVKRAELRRLLPVVEEEGIEQIGGLLDRFNGPARTVCLKLLAGASILQASAAAGKAKNTIDAWRQRDVDFQRAVGLCLDLGSALYESELHTRALAGTDDRGSMRALELVVKARNPDYRDKSQVQMGVLHVFQQALSDSGGWRGALPAGPDAVDG